MFLNENNIYRAIPLRRFDWVEHGFGTRHAKWNGQPLVTLPQIHSDRILVASAGEERIGEGDALITNREGFTLAVRTADCLPILLIEDRRRAVAAIHAGWRGSAAGIAAKTVEALISEYGGSPGNIHAAIGPGIGVCCYQVGLAVAERFRRWLPELPAGPGPVMLDLVEANRRQLAEAGVPPGQIHAGKLCTCCGREQFFSYRREPGSGGRMTSCIGINTNGAFKH
ncbi:MAG: peptidoglycan editing factor PgeF [Bryobacteraceae bacterium]|nr:peptidoglycan editing factor PgeF [Bryobacteraceae bacterium]